MQGKQLFSIFKEAKASYGEKKAQIKAEKSLQRAQTFDQSTSLHRQTLTELPYEDDNDDFRPVLPPRAQSFYYANDDEYTLDDRPRRRSYDVNSVASSSRRSHRHHGGSRSSKSKSKHHGSHAERHSERHAPPTARSPALTERNLKTHSETSSTRPSKPPTVMTTTQRYQSPYAETLPSRMDLTQVDVRSMGPDARQSAMVPRTKSESQLHLAHRPKEPDMNLAYGNIPPDLEFRVDLDPVRNEHMNHLQANSLVRKVEGILDEAHCVQHSATSIIKHLQEKPEAAAAVALTLAELSTIVSKMSPAFIGLLKGGSPAVFSLLASPQFLIGTGIAVGVTIVMFGGWKIVKKVKEAQAQQKALAYKGVPMARPVMPRAQSAHGGSYDEALIVDDDLSAIESWRRGIEPFGENESADLELITPEADRATRAEARDRFDDQDFDLKSRRSTKTHRTSKTAKTSKTQKTHHSTRTEKMHKTHKSKLHDDDIPERKSGKGSSSSVREGPSSSRSVKGKERAEVRAIEDGKSRRSKDDLDLVLRPRAQRQESDLFKSLFKGRKSKDANGSRSELVPA